MDVQWSDPVDNGANLLIAVPGGGDGPGGVLVCSENFIIYKNQVCRRARVAFAYAARTFRLRYQPDLFQ